MNESIHAEGTASEPQDRVTELIEQQTAISEVLCAIANSPHDLQPIFDAILDSATHLCRADIGSLRLSEESGLRLVAARGDPLLVSQVWSSLPALAEKGSILGRLATSRLPTHIPDFTALEGDHRDDYWIAAVNAGFRTGLMVPLLKDNEIVGIITLGRKQMQPFTDKQISLFRDFAAEASGAERLVPTRPSADWAMLYRPRTKGLFACIQHRLSEQDDYWEVRSRIGFRSLYGHPGMCGADPATVRDPDDPRRAFS